MNSLDFRVLGDVICLLVCIIAALCDLRSRRIPDWLTMPAVILGLVLSLTYGAHSLAGAVVAVVFLAGLLAMFAAAGGMGWGDVKLMAAVGALLGWPLGSWFLVFYALLFTTLAGGILGVVVAFHKGRLGAALKGVFTLHRRRKDPDGGSGVTVPYGLAICVGTCLAVLGRYFPVLLP